MNGTGTVTVPQLSVSMLPRDLLGTEVKLFLLSCCLTTVPPLHPGNSLPSWITTRFLFSLLPSLSLLLGGDIASLLTFLIIGLQVDDGLSIRVLDGMSGVVKKLSGSPFTGVLAGELSVDGLPRNRRT